MKPRSRSETGPESSRSRGRAVERRHDERLRRSERLTRRAEYQTCYRHGRRRHGRYLTVYVKPNDAGSARLGITASRKVGRAVVRQRLRRRVREIFRRWPKRSSLPALDFVVHLKPTAGEATFDELRDELVRLLGPRRSSRQRRPR